MSREGMPLYIFDWSGVISDDRKPVYEANMRLLEYYGKPRMTFGEWLPKTTLSTREFLANNGVIGEPDELFEEYLGDTIYDIQAAKKAGVYSIGTTNGYHVRERLLTENPDELVPVLFKD